MKRENTCSEREILAAVRAMVFENGNYGILGKENEFEKKQGKNPQRGLLYGGRGVPLAGAPMNGKVFSNLNAGQSNQFRSLIFVDKIIFNFKY